MAWAKDMWSTTLQKSTDRIADTTRQYAYADDGWWLASTSRVYAANNSAAATTTAAVKQRFSGFSAGVTEEQVSTDIHGNVTTATTTMDPQTKTTTRTSVVPDSSVSPQTVTVNGLPVTERDRLGAVRTNSLDALARRVAVSDPVAGMRSTVYDSLGRVAYEEDADGNRTWFGYDSQTGRRTAITNALGQITYFAFSDRGEQIRQWGAGVYPVEYVYDDYGQLAEMHTFRQGAGWEGPAWPEDTGEADVTTWIHQESTGLLTQKLDAAGEAVSYTYDHAGRLQSRTWARGLTTTYTYDTLGQLESVDYEDATPDVAYRYNRLGQVTNVVDGLGVRTLRYNSSLLPQSETVNGLYWFDVSMLYESTQGANVGGRRSIVEIDDGPIADSYTYGYDSHGRLETIQTAQSDSTYQYRYVPNSSLVATTLVSNGTSQILALSRGYDGLARLTNITAAIAGGDPRAYDYTYNDIHQRTAMRMPDGSEWTYEYDSRGQLIDANRRWPDDAPVAGHRFAYAYDPIGNRIAAVRNRPPDERTSVYRSNPLNQYTERTVPGFITATGTAATNATVTAGGHPTTRHNESFHAEWPVPNMDGSVYAEPDITAILPGAGPNGEDIVMTETRKEFVPETPEAFTYDPDGNLISDGRWLYTWNGENRLIAMETKSGLATNLPRQRLTFLYDYMGRRVRKIVADWTGSAYTPVSTNYYLYHGWNLLIERDHTGPIRQYTWGLDLSGTLEGAGGVGGLLAVIDHTQGPNAPESYAAYDGNGNLTALVDSTDGSLSAVYEYDPFGNLLRATGPMANANPFRFSTKYQDDETGLLYYGFRYLISDLGRWPNRDPIEERGGVSRYSFVKNAPVTLFDILGLIDPELGVALSLEFGWDDVAGAVISSINVVGSARQGLCDDLYLSADIGVRLYSGGLGTPNNQSAVTVDLVGSIATTIGDGNGNPTPSYSINHHSRSVIDNSFHDSLTWGQAFNYNSALGRVSRIGYVGLRSDNVFFHYNNDSSRPPTFGGGTDQGWTGGGVLGVYVSGGNSAEVAFQDFTGLQLGATHPGDGRSRRNGYWMQSSNDMGLNRAEWSLRYGGDQKAVTFTTTAPNWLNVQHGIHDWISPSTPRFEYPAAQAGFGYTLAIQGTVEAKH